jgi:hypothetical protein
MGIVATPYFFLSFLWDSGKWCVSYASYLWRKCCFCLFEKTRQSWILLWSDEHLSTSSAVYAPSLSPVFTLKWHHALFLFRPHILIRFFSFYLFTQVLQYVPIPYHAFVRLVCHEWLKASNFLISSHHPNNNKKQKISLRLFLGVYIYLHNWHDVWWYSVTFTERGQLFPSCLSQYLCLVQCLTYIVERKANEVCFTHK